MKILGILVSIVCMAAMVLLVRWVKTMDKKMYYVNNKQINPEELSNLQELIRVKDEMINEQNVIIEHQKQLINAYQEEINLLKNPPTEI